MLRLVVFPPASVRTRYCACDAWHGERWGVRAGGVLVAECTACGGRIPLGGSR